MIFHETTSIENPARTGISRRHLLKMIGVGAATLVVGATAGPELSTAQIVTQYKTTDVLNFRSGPGTTYPVIRVIPDGTIVAHTGAVQNSFYEVGYSGTYGWVHKDYLGPVGGAGSPVISGKAWTVSAVNLRSGPSTGHKVLRVVPSGVQIGVSNTVQGGFRYVSYQGQTGWMSDAYISFSDGTNQPETFTTTADLNLRAEPSTSAKVLLVMRSGSTVQAASGKASGFRQVVYKGTTGWASTNYLN
jgi:uncharacterized protein YraI